MRNKSIIRLAVVTVLMVSTLGHSAVFAHGSGRNVKLHVNPRWKQCSFQLDPSLTQEAWHQFTREAGLVTYFRPLSGAKPMGAGNFEFSILQWMAGIDDTDDAWNDTFVHPDSAHWLFEGNRLPIPGLMFRAGITNRIDVGVYFTKAVGANYGFWGGQVQYNILNNIEKNWYASTRFSLVSMYGPEDLGYTVYGLDLLASKEYAVFANWLFVSPYAGVSTYLSSSHEKTTAVSLKDENLVGIQGMIGAVAHISVARLAVEYNFAEVSTLSFRLGVGF